MSKLDFEAINNEVIMFINKARTIPSWAIDELSEIRKFYKNKEYCNPAYDFHLSTEEGIPAVDEAINFLRSLEQPLQPLFFSVALSNSAEILVKHLNFTGSTKPAAPEFDLEMRIKQELKDPGTTVENISFGWHDAKEIVLQFIVDDGEKNRGHRANLFGPQFDQIGVASGTHSKYNFCCVVDMYTKTDQSDANFEKYKMEDEEWPEIAISLEKKIDIKIEKNVRRVLLTYIFDLENGSKLIKTREFNEQF